MIQSIILDAVCMTLGVAFVLLFHRPFTGLYKSWSEIPDGEQRVLEFETLSWKYISLRSGRLICNKEDIPERLWSFLGILYRKPASRFISWLKHESPVLSQKARVSLSTKVLRKAGASLDTEHSIISLRVKGCMVVSPELEQGVIGYLRKIKVDHDRGVKNGDLVFLWCAMRFLDYSAVCVAGSVFIFLLLTNILFVHSFSVSVLGTVVYISIVSPYPKGLNFRNRALNIPLNAVD